MHSLPVFDLKGNEKGKIALPRAFSEKVRKDLIQKAVVVEASKLRQPYGSDPLAGHRTSAHYHGMRHSRYSQMNKEMARMKRIHSQGYLNMTARFNPRTVKGRRAHPPKVEKIWALKMNKKERRKALMSALSATLEKDLVLQRGHMIANVKHVPLVFEDDFQKVAKTSEAVKILEGVGLGEELERCGRRKVRAGRGKMRGRKYRLKKGPIVIIGMDEGVRKALENIPGIDVYLAKELNVSSLAPGTHPGRLAIFTKSAIVEMKELDSDGKVRKAAK
jgi:large subunit ribosomal protein L4e